MTLYRGTSWKQLGAAGPIWQNVYTISEASALEAVDVMNAIQVIEAAVHYNTVRLFRVHAVNPANKHDQRTVLTGGLHGTLDPTGLGGPLPLFCTMRCVFSDAASKPEQKYLRPPGNEANLTLGAWDGEFVTFFQDNYVTPLLAQTQYVGPSGEAHVDGQAIQVVQNRQLGWHRRHRVGFKRGWVAV